MVFQVTSSRTHRVSLCDQIHDVLVGAPHPRSVEDVADVYSRLKTVRSSSKKQSLSVGFMTDTTVLRELGHQAPAPLCVTVSRPVSYSRSQETKYVVFWRDESYHIKTLRSPL